MENNFNKWSGPSSPCEFCKDRWVKENGSNCHSSCQKYIEYKKLIEKQKKKIDVGEKQLYSQEIERIQKQCRRKNKVFYKGKYGGA